MSVDAIKKGGSFLIEETDPNEVFTPEDFSDEQKMFAKTAEDFVNNEVIANHRQDRGQGRGCHGGAAQAGLANSGF